MIRLPLTLLLAGLLSLSGPPRAEAHTVGDYYGCTRDEPLVQALAILDQSPGRGAVARIIDNHVKVVFKDMREMGKSYRDHDALSWIADNDQHMIFINKKHQQAPPQALAAIISHEAMHNDRDNSIAEEVASWHQEAQTWQMMLNHFPELKQISTGTCPLVDRLNAINVLLHQERLQKEIENNMAYRSLPPHSPGY